MEPDVNLLDITLGDNTTIPVPSGQAVVLLDIIWNSEGLDGPAPRFRFVAPAIARVDASVTFAQTEADLQHLCETFALTKLAARGITPPQIVLAMVDRAVEFGTSAPDATQFFESFSIDGATCTKEVL